jgi:uncharacterized protein (TIGR02001 family)
MTIRYKVAAAAIGLCGFAANEMALAQGDGGLFAPEYFTSTLYFTTDYVFRGVSFSDEDPAVQGSFDYAHPSGAYAGAWASNWDGFGTESELEIDYYGGYAGSVGPFDFDIGPLYYTFPGAQDPGFELDYFEAFGALSYAPEGLPLTPVVGVEYNYSPDYNGQDGDGHYGLGTLDLVLPVADIALALAYAHLDVEGGALGALVARPNGFSFSHWSVGLSKSFYGFGFDLTYHDTSSDCEREYGAPYFGSTGVCTPGAVFTLSRTF